MMRVYEFDDEVLGPGQFRFNLIRNRSVKKYKDRLFKDQNGICPLCSRPLDINHCVVDHKESVKSFAYNLSIPLTEAYVRCHAVENLRVVHPKCNSDRNRKKGRAA